MLFQTSDIHRDGNEGRDGKGKGKEGSRKCWERRKQKSGKEKRGMLFLILKTTVEVYSQKTFLSLAKESGKTTCVPDMSRCVFHN